MSGAEVETCPVCVTPEYAVAHEETWQAWVGNVELKDSRKLAEVTAEIRRPVEVATRKAARLQERARQPPLQHVSLR